MKLIPPWETHMKRRALSRDSPNRRSCKSLPKENERAIETAEVIALIRFVAASSAEGVECPNLRLPHQSVRHRQMVNWAEVS
jgi:hypothetical protein